LNSHYSDRLLAHHYGQTAQADKAFTYLVRAGEKSAGVYSLDEAERYFEQALHLCEANGELLTKNTFLDLLDNMARLLLMKSKLDVLKRLVDRHGQHAEGLGDSPQWVAVLSNYSFATSLGSDFGLALVAANRALAMAERLNDDRAKAYARASFLYAKTIPGHLSQEEADHHRALLVAERQRVTDPNLHIMALVASAWDYFLRGHTDAARAQALDRRSARFERQSLAPRLGRCV
jgi:tetratricopeptide (TPR) repeat protein